MKMIILFFGMCICVCKVKAQDTLWLKSGKSLAGQIVSFADNSVKIKTEKDILIYRLDEINSLRYNGPAKKTAITAPVPIERKEQENRKQEKPVKAGTTGQ